MRLYRTGALLTGARSELIPHAGVLVDGTRIVAAGPLDSLAAEHGLPPDVVDLGDLTVLPGLVDAHVHLGFDGGPGPVARMNAETDTEQLILMLRSARELLSAGVTTARDLGARSFLDVAVRAAIASGMAAGPRLVTAARPLTPTGGHCWFMGGECDSADELRRMVRLHHKMGADFVKVMSTGGFMTEGAPPWSAQFTPAELDAVVTEAHRLGKRVAAHALTLRDRFGDALNKVIMGLYSGGAQIIAGTDAGIDNCPHDDYVSGLEALAMVGLPAAEILDAATLRAARALGVDDRTGTIEPGKDADLIAVRGDPRSDISVLHEVKLVVARGAEHRPAPRRARPPAGPPPGGPDPGPEPAAAPSPRHAGAARALAAQAGPGPR
jgi:imidazolonepropionase-like amidohydrolase